MYHQNKTPQANVFITQYRTPIQGLHEYQTEHNLVDTWTIIVIKTITLYNVATINNIAFIET